MTRRATSLLLAPAALLVGCAFLAPFALLVLMSVWSQPPGSLLLDPTPTAANYARVLTDGYYLGGLWRTVWLSSAATLACLALALPLAYFVSRRAGRLRGAILAVVLMPLVCGALLPTLGLVNLLSPLGVVNGTLRALGLVERSLPILGTAAGVLVGLVHAFLPLMVLPLVTVLDTLPPDYEEAAMSLGARRRDVWRHVVLPLAAPGIVAGSLLVFCASLTSFVTPQILGQGKVPTFATMAYQQAALVLDWPFASAIAVVMLALLALAALAAWGLRALARP